MHIDIDMYIKYVLMFCSSHKWLFKKERKKKKDFMLYLYPSMPHKASNIIIHHNDMYNKCK